MSVRLPDITTNNTGDVEDLVLWESIKAVCRGSIISYVAGRRKQIEKRLMQFDETVS